MSEFIKRVGKISIQGRILISFCVLLTISYVTAGVLSFNLIRRYSQETAIVHSEQVLSLAKQNIDGVFESVESIARQIVLNDTVIEYCEDADTMSEYERIMMEQLLARNLIGGALGANTRISSIYLYPTEGYCLSFGERQQMATRDYKDRAVYQKGMEAEKTCWFKSRHIRGPYGEEEGVISMTWPVRSSDFWAVIGLLEIQISDSEVTPDLEEIRSGNESGVLLLDEERDFAIKQPEEFLNSGEIFDAVQKQKKLKKESISLEIADNEYLINYESLNNGWMLVHYQPMKALTRTSDEVCMIILISGGFVLVLLLIFSGKLSRQLVRPIHEAIDSTSHMEREEELQSDRKEIAALYSNYNLMMRRIREAELDTLRAQVSPHFLYNTLNSIRCRALLDRNKDVAQMIQWLINLLELSINNRNEYVTLNGEIEILKSYVGLQQMRMGRDFRLSVDVSPEDLGECLIPKMILQTLVENAILHGLEEEEAAGEILVQAAEKNGCLIIEVIDDGKGMSEERIREVLSGKTEERKGRLNRVGIYNVDQRIKLYFGRAYGLSIESRLGQGTRVIIKMPVVKNPEQYQEVK